MEIFRNLYRRKLRSFLTLFGIVIGIYALTVMGSMSEKMNLLIDGGIEYVTGQISITPKGSGLNNMAGGVLKYDTIAKIKKIKGVKNVSRDVSFMLSDSGNNMQFGLPETVAGADLDSNFKNRNWADIDMEKGRLIKKGDKGVCTIGIDISKSKKLEIGDYLKIRKKKFKVTGIFAKTMTGPDKVVIINRKEAQSLYVDSNPLLKSLRNEAKKALKIDKKVLATMNPVVRKRIEEAKSFKVDEVITGVSVQWKDGYDPEKLSEKIEDNVDGIDAISPEKGRKSFEQASLIINAVVLGSTVIALIVGGLAVLNTMFMAVNERIKEIGIKQAVGAKTRHIMKEILAEAIVISIFGAVIGIILGFLSITAVNSYTSSTGVEIFELTGRLVWISLGFAVVLGLAGGFYPALRASRFQPVKALREDK